MPAVSRQTVARATRADVARGKTQQELKVRRAALETEFDRIIREENLPGKVIRDHPDRPTLRLIFSARYYGRPVVDVESCPDCHGPAVQPLGGRPCTIYLAHTRHCRILDRGTH